MSHQPGLFDDPQAAKREAVDRVEANAHDLWLAAALDAAHDAAVAFEEFTSDQVWEHLENCGHETHDPRALGAVMRQAARRGWCEATDRIRPSTRTVNHARPVAIWRSLIHGPWSVEPYGNGEYFVRGPGDRRSVSITGMAEAQDTADRLNQEWMNR